MEFNVTFNIFQLYRCGKFYWWRKPEYPEKKHPILKKVVKSGFSILHIHIFNKIYGINPVISLEYGKSIYYLM